MNGSSLGYLIGEGARNIHANRQMSVASIGVLVACMLLIGAAVGLMVTFLVRDKLSNAALLTLGGMLFVKLWEYFFAYGIWGYDPTGQIFWTRILPTVLYSTLWTPLWYWLFGRLSEYFARRLEVR